MKYPANLILVLVFAMTFFSLVIAQDDEVRQGSGLPTLIGENVARGGNMNVSGRVSLQTDGRLSRRPIIKVTILRNGSPVDTAIATDAGVYLVRNVPRESATIVVEVDGAEVVRQPILVSAMSNPRLDFTVLWPLAVTTAKPAVISANSEYVRSEKNEALFHKVVEAERSNDLRGAMNLLNEILTADPKDFTAWTEVGTIYFRSASLDNAEAGYIKAIELRKDYYPALINLGRLYMHRKQFDNAVLVLANAVLASPGSADAHSLLGEAYLQSKKGSIAVKHLNEAIRLAPEPMAPLHLRLAALYDAAGDRGRAAREYKAFLLKRPDHPERSKLEEYVKANPPK